MPSALAQQAGDTVPESMLHGPTFALPPPGMAPRGGRHGPPRAERPGDDVAGAYIRQLQRELPKQGYHPGPVTGRADPATVEAIETFQESQGLERNTGDVLALRRTLDRLTYGRPPAPAVPETPAVPEAPPAPAAPAETTPAPTPGTPVPLGPADASVAVGSTPDVEAPVAPPSLDPGSPETIGWVQDRLRAKGYDIATSGTLDTETLNAIKVFQASNDLPKDGRIDKYLLDLLRR